MDRLDTLSVFVTVAEQGSFVAAARRLGRSPAAVTRAVASLEDRLATRLLTRTTRAVALTEAGQSYLEQARRALAEFAELENSAANARAQPTGLLTLTAPEMFGRMHVLPVAMNFMREFPAVDVSLVLLNRLVSFVDEGVDLGVRIAHLPDSTLCATQLGSVRRTSAPARPISTRWASRHILMRCCGIGLSPSRASARCPTAGTSAAAMASSRCRSNLASR